MDFMIVRSSLSVLLLINFVMTDFVCSEWESVNCNHKRIYALSERMLNKLLAVGRYSLTFSSTFCFTSISVARLANSISL
jgi:hypothetical protein